MVKNPNRFWRNTSFVILSLALAGIAAAMGVLLATFQRGRETVAEEAMRRYLAGMAVVSGVLLIFALFCIGLLVIRYLTFRVQLERSRHAPTEYVDVWRLAGQRFRLPEEQDDYDGPVDVELEAQADPNEETDAAGGPPDFDPDDEEDKDSDREDDNEDGPDDRGG